MALIVAGLGLLVWERALNARFAAVAVLTLGIFYIAFALDGGFGLPALPRGEDRRLWEGAMCALTFACIALLVWQKREEPPALDALPPNTYIVTSCATPVRPGPGREFTCGDLYALRGDLLNGVRTAGWRPVLLEGEVLWISGKDCRKIEAAPPRAVQVTVERAQLYRGPGRDFPARRGRSARRQAGSPERRRLAPRPRRGRSLLGQPGGDATVRWRQRIKAADGAHALSQRQEKTARESGGLLVGLGGLEPLTFTMSIR